MRPRSMASRDGLRPGDGTTGTPERRLPCATTDRRPQPKSPPRVHHRRDLRGRPRADRHRDQVGPRRQGEHRRRLRAHREGRGLARSVPTSRRWRAGTGTTTSRSGTASCCSTGARSTSCSGATKAEGPDDRPAAALHDPRQGQARARAGAGKQLHDRRRDIADRDSRRDIARELADAQRGRRPASSRVDLGQAAQRRK